MGQHSVIHVSKVPISVIVKHADAYKGGGEFSLTNTNPLTGSVSFQVTGNERDRFPFLKDTVTAVLQYRKRR